MNLLQILAQCNDKRITVITHNYIERKLVLDNLLLNKATFLNSGCTTLSSPLNSVLKT
jgi:hypothetical protein